MIQFVDAGPETKPKGKAAVSVTAQTSEPSAPEPTKAGRPARASSRKPRRAA